jgi:hypothetical protein
MLFAHLIDRMFIKFFVIFIYFLRKLLSNFECGVTNTLVCIKFESLSVEKPGVNSCSLLNRVS